ncbi:MAG: PadR family transcriptional regulator [Candidatus Lernaella stagnicola]|nr:PadR family transcriptional regulator [Candidatus Lernaella stagnicola]
MNRNKKFAYNVQLAILGFLKEKDFYGYELKKVMERFMGPWTNIKFGSIYYALEKLAQEGLVEPVREEKEGAQPSRMIYQITDKGRHAFDEMLLESLDAYQQFFFLLDVALFFSGSLDRSLVEEKLHDRAEKSQQLYELMEALKTTHHGNEIAQILVRHHQMHLETERDFLLEVAERFANHDPFAGKSVRDWLDAHPPHEVSEEVKTN